MKIDPSKILNENDFKFLKEHSVIRNLAELFGIILNNYKTDIKAPFNSPKYSDIRTCLLTNIEVIKDFENNVDNLLHHLNEIKHSIAKGDSHKVINIHDINNFKKETTEQLAQLLFSNESDSKSALEEVKKIEGLNPDFLYCFFNYECWGQTRLGEYGLHKEEAEKIDNPKQLLDFATNRLLGFKIGRMCNVIEEQKSEVSKYLWQQDEERYYSGEYVDDNYYLEVNSRICSAISRNFTQIIIILRDACRKILQMIKYVYQDEIFNDEQFEKISKNIIVSFDPFKDVLLKRELKKFLLKMLVLIYDYKKDIEEHLWIYTSKYKNEDDFHDNLEAYLTRVRRGEKISVTHEGKKGSGKLDFEVNEQICIELKFNENGYSSIDEIISKHTDQLKEYTVDRGRKIGFLLALNLSDQEEPFADRENYITAFPTPGGKGVKEGNDTSPIGIVVFWIFGGKRIPPSQL